MTIALAIGVQRMARRHAVIRRLPAVETLGSVTVICSTKPAPHPQREMTVQQVALDGLAVEWKAWAMPRGSHRARRRTSRGRCSHRHRHRRHHRARGISGIGPGRRAVQRRAPVAPGGGKKRLALAGDPTEGALLTLAMKAGLNPDPSHRARHRLDVVPFESGSPLHGHAAPRQ